MSVREELTRAVASCSGVRLLVLFGSVARGTGHVRSDVDVGVLLEDNSLEARRAVEVALGQAVGRAVDMVHLGDAPPQLRFEIARDGVLVHEGRPHAWADFRVRAMLDWWDWAPTARMIHAAAVRRLRQPVEHGPP